MLRSPLFFAEFDTYWPNQPVLMMTLRLTILLGGIALAGGCAEPPPPRSVQEFLDNPIVLEAALVRCSRNRSESRYDAGCINAREANRIVAAKEEAERRAEFEAQSERKRQALRRAQQAAAEARRRAAEAEKQREEAAYLSQFGQLPSDGSQPTEQAGTGNVPMAVIPAPVEEAANTAEPGYSESLAEPAPAASNAPAAGIEPQPETEAQPVRDLDEIREELQRRNEE
jgi:membrane-bound lytic murein transglycosylase